MEADRIFQGPIPALYDQHLGPMIFAPYASDLASRLTDLRHGRVLETAAGTGIVTRALLSALPDEVSIEATDINQAMLDQASGVISSPRVTWRQADAQSLPFPDGSFDAVVCQFGAMFFPDKQQGYREARRVLKPGGTYLFNVWDRIEHNDFADVVTSALAAQFPGDPPRFLARTPHGYHDTAQIERELRAAGFTDVQCDWVEAVSKAASPLDVAIAYCHGTPLRNEIEARDPDGLERATRKATEALTKKFGAGPIEGRIRACVIAAKA